MDKPRRSSSAGFTLTEMLIVAGFFVAVSAAGLALFGSVTPSIRANGQVNRILSLLQNARDQAIARQRMHILRFDQTVHSVRVFRVDAGVETLVDAVVFEYGVRLGVPSLPDTPDGYGNQGAIDFSTTGDVMFDSEGSLVDDDGVPCNGTIYFGIPGQALTARAVTITGSTGRPRFYVWNSNATWTGGWLAK